MSARIVFVSAALLVVSGAALSQPKVVPPVPPPPANGNLIPPPSVPLPAVPVAPREKTVDELLSELEQVQAQKAALDKQEAELKAAIRKKLDAQAERLKKLGVAGPAKDKEPDRIGRIVIEGNTKTAEQTIFFLIEFRAGQVLHYPTLEAARQRLEKAGFTDVAVEVMPGAAHANYCDVRVKVTEPQPPVIVPAGR